MLFHVSSALNYRFCPHCEKKLAPRTFREHMRLFYDASTCTWTKRRVNYMWEQDSNVLTNDVILEDSQVNKTTTTSEFNIKQG